MTQVEIEQLKVVIDRLISEDREYNQKERRSVQRLPFFRPATLWLGRQQEEPQSCFVRDISERGIGMVHQFNPAPDRMGTIGIHRLWDEPMVFRANCRWSECWGSGWFISGWNIHSIERE